MHRTQILLLLVLASLFACRKEVENTFPGFENKPVVNAILSADSSLQVHVSLSQPIGPDSIGVIKTAQVQYTNSSAVNLLAYDTLGVYTFNGKLAENTTGELKVHIPDYAPVTIHFHIPPKPKVVDFTFLPGHWVDDEGIPCPSVQISIIDNPEFSYYQVWAKQIDWGYYCDYLPVGHFTTNNPMGDTIQKLIDIPIYSLGSNSEYQYQIEVRAVDKAMYNYLESLELYQMGRFPTFDAGSTVPNNLYSNIPGGYGIIGCYSAVLSDTLGQNIDSK
jgi:hypothetical protein